MALACVSLAVGHMVATFGAKEFGLPEAAAFAARGVPKLKAAYAEQ